MKMIALQSGSSGNCIYVEADGVNIVFDAGISGRQAELRLAAHGRDIRDVDALVISHDHRDHSRCMGIYQRKYGIPVHVSRKTLAATRARHDLGEIRDLRHYTAGASLRFGRVTVETIPTPHDGVDGVAFVVDDGRHRLGILTDLGHVFDDPGRRHGVTRRCPHGKQVLLSPLRTSYNGHQLLGVVSIHTAPPQ